MAADLGRLARGVPACGAGPARDVLRQAVGGRPAAVVAEAALRPFRPPRREPRGVRRHADGEGLARRVARHPAPRAPRRPHAVPPRSGTLVHLAGVAAREADRPRGRLAAQRPRPAHARLRGVAHRDRAAFRGARLPVDRPAAGIARPRGRGCRVRVLRAVQGRRRRYRRLGSLRRRLLRHLGVGRRADLRRRRLLPLSEPPRDPRGLGHRACTAPAGRAAARAEDRRDRRDRDRLLRRLPAAGGRSGEIGEGGDPGGAQGARIPATEGRHALALSRRGQGRSRPDARGLLGEPRGVPRPDLAGGAVDRGRRRRRRAGPASPPPHAAVLRAGPRSLPAAGCALRARARTRIAARRRRRHGRAARARGQAAGGALASLSWRALGARAPRPRAARRRGHRGRCVTRGAQGARGTRADYFGRLVRAWQSAAYAGRLPGAGETEALAHDWAPHFAPRAGTAA